MRAPILQQRHELDGALTQELPGGDESRDRLVAAPAVGVSAEAGCPAGPARGRVAGQLTGLQTTGSASAAAYYQFDVQQLELALNHAGNYSTQTATNLGTGPLTFDDAIKKLEDEIARLDKNLADWRDSLRANQQRNQQLKAVLNDPRTGCREGVN